MLQKIHFGAVDLMKPLDVHSFKYTSTNLHKKRTRNSTHLALSARWRSLGHTHRSCVGWLPRLALLTIFPRPAPPEAGPPPPPIAPPGVGSALRDPTRPLPKDPGPPNPIPPTPPPPPPPPASPISPDASIIPRSERQGHAPPMARHGRTIRSLSPLRHAPAMTS